MLHIKFKRIAIAAKTVPNNLPAYPTSPNPMDGSIGQKSTFSEHGIVACQIKDLLTNALTW